MTGRSNTTISYAAMLNKNVAKPVDTISSEITKPIVQSNKKQAKAEANPQSKEEFPELNTTPAENVPAPAQNVVVQSQPEPTVVEEPKPVVLITEEVNEENNDNGEFIEKKKRNSDRNRDNKPRSSLNKRPPQGQRTQARSAGNRKPNETNGTPARRDSSDLTKTFNEKFEEEKAKYTERFKESTGEFCFKLVKGDLFSANEDVSLAHCVSEDFSMSKGIATEFKKRFNGVPELLEQNVKIGGCAYLKDNDRYIFYLVTKKFFFHKPYYNSIEKSLKEMRSLCKKHQVKDLAMPMIGSGLDRLDWNIVEKIIDQVFRKENLNITIYKFEKNRQNFNKSGNNTNNQNADDNSLSASTSSN